jgi:hypothetical protein
LNEEESEKDAKVQTEKLSRLAYLKSRLAALFKGEEKHNGDIFKVTEWWILKKRLPKKEDDKE